MMELQSEVTSTSAVAKVSMSASFLPVRVARFCEKSWLRIVSQNGFVEDYRLQAGSMMTADKDEPEKLSVDVKPFRSFDISRAVDDTVLPATPMVGVTTASPVSSQHKQIASSPHTSFDVSVSNFEVQPFCEPLVPIWASPQFALVQTTAGNGEGKGDPNSMFYMPEGSRLEVRSATPPPGLADAIRTSAFG